MSTDLAARHVEGLLRSAYLIETARARLYERWARGESSFAASQRRAEQRARILAEGLPEGTRLPGDELVEAHTSWLVSVVGNHPGEVPLSVLFVARLGDWVDAHAGPFADRTALTALSDEEKAGLTFPESLPEPSPYAPLPAEAAPPGEVLFRFAILGDLHAGSPHAEELALAAIRDINASGAAVTIQLGDLADHGERDEMERAASLLHRLDMPWATMTGNHDMYSASTRSLSGRANFEACFGRPADGTMLTHGGFRFVVLDSAEEAASPFPPFDIVTGGFLDGPGGAVVSGRLTPPQHDLLAEIAGPSGGPAFVFLHHPVQPYTGFPPLLFGLDDTDSGRLHAVCDSGNVWGIFSGHTHRNARTATYSGVPALEVGIPRDFPHGYALVDVCDNGYSYRFVQLSDAELVARHYPRASEIQRRYAGGAPSERAFSWTAPA